MEFRYLRLPVLRDLWLIAPVMLPTGWTATWLLGVRQPRRFRSTHSAGYRAFHIAKHSQRGARLAPWIKSAGSGSCPSINVVCRRVYEFSSTSYSLTLLKYSQSCLRYGESVSVGGEVVQPPPVRTYPGWYPCLERNGHSSMSSWLPTDFEVSESGKSLSLRGYINNIHPQQQTGLQHAIVTLLAKFLPLFERTLGDLRAYSTKSVIGDEQSRLDESTHPVNPKTGEPIEHWDEMEDEDSDNSDTHDQDLPTAWDRWIDTKPYIDPVPQRYVPEERLMGDGYTLGGKTIQVIVKVAEM
jgi:hypothetical protein